MFRFYPAMACLVFLGSAFAQPVLPASEVPSAESGNVLDSIAALVEDDVILRSELDGAIAAIRRQYAGKEDQLPPVEVLEKQVLERMVVAKLQIQRAEETGVEVTDTEIDQGVARVASSNKLTVEQLQGALERDGVRLLDFRRNLREELLAQKLRQRVVQSRSEVNESEIDILLASGQLKSGELKLAHILIEVPENASNDQVEIARKKAEGIRDLLQSGKMEFSAAAIRYSNADNALDGGLLGWRRLDQIPGLFADALDSLKAGDVTQPLRSGSGVHLLKILESRDDSQVMVTEYRARHLMIRVDELHSDAESEKKIRTIAQEISDGMSFEDAAKKYSDDAQTAALGGDLGWFDLQAYGSTYAETIGGLTDEGISAPARTDQGWHLIQRLGKREQDKTDEYVRNQARDSLRQRKGEEAFEQFLRQLRNESFVESRIDKAG